MRLKGHACVPVGAGFKPAPTGVLEPAYVRISASCPFRERLDPVPGGNARSCIVIHHDLSFGEIIGMVAFAVGENGKN